MIKKLEEIDIALAKLEELTRTLRSERDCARDAADNLKKQLDDRELELLQLDDEIQSMTKRHEEELSAMRDEQRKSEERLDSLAGRIREMIPMLSEESREKKS